MTIQQLVFYAFSFLAIVSSCMVIVSKHPVMAVLNLVFCFFCMAGLWMMLESELLAIVLILVYVGAVMVLFLFVVMMLDVEMPDRKAFVRFWPIGLIIAGVTLTLLVLAVGKQHFGLELIAAPAPKPADYSQVKILGTLLYTDYILPFEVAGVILLVAMIAAIGLTFRGARSTKAQKPNQQVQVTKSDRLKIVKMPSEKGEAI